MTQPPAGDLVATPETALATPVPPGPAWGASDDEVAARCHPLYAGGIARAPRGRLVSRGLPFELAEVSGERRWIAVDGPRRVDLGGVAATHLVLLYFCDAWRDAMGARPVATPVGWVLPVGEPLARAVIRVADGAPLEITLRRRFEVNEGIVGWGSMAFLALPHLVERALDWRGPHPRMGPGRGAPAGHAGPLVVLPGSWGADQTGVEDHVPSATDDLTLWLHAIDVRGPDGAARRLEALELAPLPGEGDGRLVVVAALTAFRGADSPLRWAPRRSLGVRGAVGRAITVDMGIVARRRPLVPPPSVPLVSGWGLEPGGADAEGGVEEVELTAAADAVLLVGDQRVPLAALEREALAPGRVGLRAWPLPELDRRLALEIVDGDGRPTPARVRILAPDGRYLAPLGHRTEVNPGLAEDLGADVLLGGSAWAYVDGRLEVDLPADGALIEVVSGPDRAPVRHAIDAIEAERGDLRIRLPDPLRPAGGRWVSGDTHVHFLAPSTALLQARAEGVNAVHLLATQWGDHHTSQTDLGGDIVDAGGDHAVWVGSENRQNMLGHIGVVGTSRPLRPFASGGPPEGPIGAPVTHLMADWLRRCRELGGLAIGAHFPLPMAEVAADIDAGLLDALEVQAFDPALESPPIREWYRYLSAGYDLPIVGGTDKMSAEVPLGQVRTWARLGDDEGLTFASWARAVRAGRTFVTSGPLLELRVEGREPGERVALPSGATVEVEAVASAAQPVVSGIEVVLDGIVVSTAAAAEPSAELRLRDRVRVERSGWLAARSRSPYAIGSAFASAMVAHTSPVYLEVAGRPRAAADMTMPLALVDGTRAWLEALAPIRDPRERERFRRFLDESERRLRERGG